MTCVSRFFPPQCDISSLLYRRCSGHYHCKIQSVFLVHKCDNAINVYIYKISHTEVITAIVIYSDRLKALCGLVYSIFQGLSQQHITSYLSVALNYHWENRTYMEVVYITDASRRFLMKTMLFQGFRRGLQWYRMNKWI